MGGKQACVQLRELTFSWPDTNTTQLDIAQLSISPGESLFIQGPSGSGKSTLLNLITGVLSPSSGNISILGQALNSQRRRDQFRADHFGIIFQQFNLIPYLNVFENVTLPLLFSTHRRMKLSAFNKDAQHETRRLLDLLGLDEQGIAQRNITGLSVGQQQRVAAARALIGCPEIIIADEPTSALDADNRHNFLKLLFEESNKTNSALVLVSHDPSLAGHFDNAISMGEINRARFSNQAGINRHACKHNQPGG